jgi:nucleolar complex protein 2
LLEFNDSDEEETADDAPPLARAARASAAEAADAADADEAPAAAEDDELLLTSERVAELCAAAAAGDSLAHAAKLLRAFRACAHYGDQLGGDEAEAGAARRGAARALYSRSQPSLGAGGPAEGEQMKVASSAAFNRMVVFVLSNAPAILRSLLGGKAESGGAALLFRPEAQPRWKKVQPLARSFLGNALHLQAQLRDAGMTAFALRSLCTATPFAVPFPRLAKLLLRAALARFGDGAPAVRLQALRLLRSLALVSSPEGLDAVFRGAYRTFASNAKFATAAQAESVAFMAAGLVELFRLDPGAAYPLAFGAIRSLAGLLRAALTARSKDAYRDVYCWQTVHCLELWGRVLAALAATPTDALRPLLYPLLQLLQGATRLLPSARHAPLRLRLLALTGRLAGATGTYVPLAAAALELLGCSELSKPPLSGRAAGSGGGGGGGDYGGALRVAKAELRSPAFHAFLVDRSLDVACEALLQWAYHPAFPELAHLALRELRAFARASPAPRFQRAASSLADAITRNIAWVAARRDGADFAPKHCVPGGAVGCAAWGRSSSSASMAPQPRASQHMATAWAASRRMSSSPDEADEASAVAGAPSGAPSHSAAAGVTAAASPRPSATDLAPSSSSSPSTTFAPGS